MVGIAFHMKKKGISFWTGVDVIHLIFVVIAFFVCFVRTEFKDNGTRTKEAKEAKETKGKKTKEYRKTEIRQDKDLNLAGPKRQRMGMRSGNRDRRNNDTWHLESSRAKTPEA